MAAISCRGLLLKTKSVVRLKHVSPAIILRERKCQRLQINRDCTTHQYAIKGTNSRRKMAYLHELYQRRIEVGPEKERHPSVYGCWSHDAELYAFGQRFGESFDEKLLKQAFIQRSFVEQEMEKQRDLGLEVETELEDNTELSKKGHSLASRFIKAYLRYSYPQLFEEGICAIHDNLMSEEMLYHIGSNIGLKDLILSAEYPPEDHNYVTTLMAVIGALKESQGEHRAEMLVLDFIVSQLVGKDINELWTIDNPMGLLAALLKESGRGEPEPRLLWKSATQTIMPLYYVGIYSDKKPIGKSPGESAIIAEEMAAREALKSLLKLEDSRAPLVLGDRARNIQLDYETENRSVAELLDT